MENPWERIAEQIFGEGAEDQVSQEERTIQNIFDNLCQLAEILGSDNEKI